MNVADSEHRPRQPGILDTMDTPPNTSDYDAYAEMVTERSPELFCDNCGHYPIEPVHGHFMCPSCHMPTKCCEGGPINV